MTLSFSDAYRDTDRLTEELSGGPQLSNPEEQPIHRAVRLNLSDKAGRRGQKPCR